MKKKENMFDCLVFNRKNEFSDTEFAVNGLFLLLPCV